jgi:CubicO group peptidase (beta-lactamase class C family)
LQPIAPGDAGFAPDLEARLDKAVASKRIWNQHGLIVLRNDRPVLERYFEGEDEARGVGDIGRVTFKPDTMHDLRSCSKSIVGLLYGIALQQGKVPPSEAPLFSAFPEYADLADKDGRDRLTIQHVLTMTMGTDWDESSDAGYRATMSVWHNLQPRGGRCCSQTLRMVFRIWIVRIDQRTNQGRLRQ